MFRLGRFPTTLLCARVSSLSPGSSVGPVSSSEIDGRQFEYFIQFSRLFRKMEKNKIKICLRLNRNRRFFHVFIDFVQPSVYCVCVCVKVCSSSDVLIILRSAIFGQTTIGSVHPLLTVGDFKFQNRFPKYSMMEFQFRSGIQFFQFAFVNVRVPYSHSLV